MAEYMGGEGGGAHRPLVRMRTQGNQSILIVTHDTAVVWAEVFHTYSTLIVGVSLEGSHILFMEYPETFGN